MKLVWIYNWSVYILSIWEPHMQGDDIEIHVEGSRVFSVKKPPDRRELLARLRKYRGRLPDGFVFDRLEVHERD